MVIYLGSNQYPLGTKKSIQFLWDKGNFEIRTYDECYIVPDSEIVKRRENYFFCPSKIEVNGTFREIEIPENIIERKNQLNIDLKIRKNSIKCINHKEGKIYFSLNSDGKIIAKLGCKEAIADEIETIENKKAIDVRSLGLECPYIEVPSEVENAFEKAKNLKIMSNCHLVYAGRSLLTGKHYFKLNSKIPAHPWNCVADYFEYFGESEEKNRLSGWLTYKPEEVERILGLTENTIKDRKTDIEKQKEKVQKEQEKEFSIKIK